MFVISFLLVLFLCAACNASNVTVSLPNFGKIVGSSDGLISSFLGIPFAKAPVGPLRWAAPQSVDPWTTTKTTQTLPNICVQLNYEFAPSNFIVGNEDCLYLNVWAPTAPPAPGTKYPVMYYIMGGGFNFFAYQTGAQLAAAYPNTIIVIPHYRVSIFGWMATSTAQSGNYGLLDQLASLKFFRQVLNAFHGDINRITIVGQSAGSISICLLLTSPAAVGLFSQVIMQSGGCDLPIPGISAYAATASQFFAAKSTVDLFGGVNCTTARDFLACARGLDAKALQYAVFLGPAGYKAFALPIIDGVLLPDQPHTLLSTGRFIKVPTLLGSAKDEWGYYAAYSASTYLGFTWAEIPTLLGITNDGSDINNYYSSSNPAWNNLPWKAFDDYNGAFLFQCSTKRDAYYLTHNRPFAPVWLYSWEYNSGRGFFSQFGAVHSMELPYLFKNPTSNPDNYLLTGGFLNATTEATIGGGFFLPSEQTIISTIQQYWFRFIHNGDPNLCLGVDVQGALFPATWWERYTPIVDNYLSFSGYAGTNIQTSINFGYHTQSCNFQQQLLYPTTHP